MVLQADSLDYSELTTWRRHTAARPAQQQTWQTGKTMASKTTFSCGDALDIVHASSLYSRLQKSLEKSTTIELKADAVEKADTAGLQLIAALSKEAAKTGGKLIWKKPSKTLTDAAERLGLSQSIGLN
jgi:anti-anti-sigma regulatory factor